MNDRAAWLQGPSAQCENLPSSAANPWRLVLLGPPGVGKGTQAALLTGRLHACHLSTGDVFRACANRGESEQSQAMRDASEFMRRGALVPDATVWAMVKERSACLHCGGGFILDGFPRTLTQAQSLNELLEDEGLPLTAVINYEVPLDQIVARLGGRLTCKNCKAVFHVTECPPAVAGACDHCGGALFQRDDDNPDAIKIRMETYERSTAPLIEFYKNLGVLLPVSSTGLAEQICDQTITSLALLASPI